MLSISINDLAKVEPPPETQCTLNKFADVIKLRRMSDTADEGTLILWKHEKFKDWDKRNFVKFNEEKCRVMHLG